MAKVSSQLTLSTKVEKVGGNFCLEINKVCFLTQIEPEIRDWLFELQDESRLNIALKAFKAIDQQMHISTDAREVVEKVFTQMGDNFGNMKDNIGTNQCVRENENQNENKCDKPRIVSVTSESKRCEISAVHDRDIFEFLKSLNLLQEFNEGCIHCKFCEARITFENLQAIYPKDNEIIFCCDRIKCFEQAIYDHRGVETAVL